MVIKGWSTEVKNTTVYFKAIDSLEGNVPIKKVIMAANNNKIEVGNSKVRKVNKVNEKRKRQNNASLFFVVCSYNFLISNCNAKLSNNWGKKKY